MPTLRSTRRAAIGALASVTAIASASAEGVRPDATMLQYPDVSATDIVFVYANDLWLVPRTGGQARKLASPQGQELFPKFSPDGKDIAFMGNYDGNMDLYVVPADGAGIAQRVTHHPTAERLTGWTPDGDLMFHASGFGGLGRMQTLHTVSPEGGLPEKLPVPYGANGAVSPDGKWLAYSPHQRDSRTWKRYRGGMATDVWLFNLDTYEWRSVTDWEGTDTLPMWHNDTLYYLSDAGPAHRLNIWSFDPGTGQRQQVTFYEEFDVKWPSMGPGTNGRGEIVFQSGPDVYLLDLRSAKSRAVEIVIPGDRPSLRDQRVDFSEFVAGGDISPEGNRVIAEARGDLWSLPAEKGVTRNLTRTSGIAERNPVWSPSGKWIAYLSDETGEYEVYVTQSDGKGDTRQLTDNGTSFRYLKSWSPDSKKILFSDKTGAMYLVDVETKEQTHVATEPWSNQVSPSWSHDSRWLTFHMGDPDNTMSVVHLYNVETGELTPVTSNFFDSNSPTFDRKGDFLYFASSRNFSPTYSGIDTTFVYNDAEMLVAVPLRADVENPWALESDEVEWDDEETDEEDADGEDADDESDTDTADADGEAEEDSIFAGWDTEHVLWGVWEGEVTGLGAMGAPDPADYRVTFLVREDGSFIGVSEMMGETEASEDATFDVDSGKYRSEKTENGMTITSEATLSGDTLNGNWSIEPMGMSGSWTLTRTDAEVTEDFLEEHGDGAEDEAAEIVEIDVDGFEGRAMALNVDPGNFAQLQVNDKNQLMYMRFGAGGPPAIKLYDIEKDDDGEKNALGGAFGFGISADGKKMVAVGPAGWAVVSAGTGQSMSKTIDTDRMVAYVNPREEWQQIFTDAWRIQRDFFYDEGLHGVDWEYMKERYGAMIDDCVTREDVSYVIRELISELNVGHAYYWGGDTEDTENRAVGLLGCDFELVEDGEHSAYRISHIYHGADWDVDAKGPLSHHGVDVKEGDFLLAVNGVEVSTDRDPWANFLELNGEMTSLTVSEKPYMDEDAREVLVEPMGWEGGLRYRHWVETNRKYVDYKTGGRIGYIYVPNTGVQGQNELFRQFYGQRHKDALIIDERWNGGGQIPTRFIELLNRPVTNYWARRDGKDWMWPPDSHQGPKAMLINGLAGSGGDMFPALFRQNGLGKLIGQRTWGGLVGISGNPALIDGGYTAVPTFGYYENDGTWGIEGHGVDPDIPVIDDPSLMAGAGPDDVADPQLDAAIAHLLGELEHSTFERPARPAGPDRSGMGIAEEDK